jgi:hypothetical protein
MSNLSNKKMSLGSYKKAKIRMLKNEFRIQLTEEQEEHINSLQSEIAIDNYVRGLLW